MTNEQALMRLGEQIIDLIQRENTVDGVGGLLLGIGAGILASGGLTDEQVHDACQVALDGGRELRQQVAQ